jgi:hypothetical protein
VRVPELSTLQSCDDEDAPRPLLATFTFFIFCGLASGLLPVFRLFGQKRDQRH